jgi:hypothetical protein
MIVPTLEDYRRYARDANVVPVMREILADYDTPVSAFSKLDRGDASFLLESMEGGGVKTRIPSWLPSVRRVSSQGRRSRSDAATASADHGGRSAERAGLCSDARGPCRGCRPSAAGGGMIGYDYVDSFEAPEPP